MSLTAATTAAPPVRPGPPTVVLASCRDLPTGDGDESALLPALAEIGVHVEWAAWDERPERFDSADLVVLRATWDYPQRRDEFLAWCDSVPTLVNPAEVARWNTDKSYLVDLARAGVPVVPTEVVAPGETPRWPLGEFVVKPAVGAGSRGAARFAEDTHQAAADHLADLHARGGAAIVQPYQPSVDVEGEMALVFFAGTYSHAFAKGPMLRRDAATDGSGLFVTERLAPAEPDPARRRVAEDAMDAASHLLGLRRTDLLYARVDVVRDHNGRPMVLELELTEPSLGLRQTDPAAALRLASAIRAALTQR
ncbi:ATP-grasp domain-containing protein [Goodfellowiella coeruleoviolacea]|uniref:ATP-grasp domain-containing protein n=1 Tax=Goodfellowiella coeruleoviolacea TaxID=334858 RepID=A0AAE3KLF0_9PSEU|nr:hypothetical protein [Goodfellowiella coeruleoviolacea]MCP2170254.1 ATP-grasp domain-containing protein [Goodfellowiella coeruleoviolacea]